MRVTCRGFGLLLILVAISLAVRGQDAPDKAQPETPQNTVTVDGKEETVYSRTTKGLKPPQAIYQVDPEYSKEGLQKKVSGTVLLALVVTSKGAPTRIRSVKGLGYGLDEKAIEAVSHWKFKPATLNGEAVSVQITVQVYYRAGL